MFKMFDRYLQHKAAMDILIMAERLTSDAIFRGEEKDIDKHIARVGTTATALAKAHVEVTKELKKAPAVPELSDREMSAVHAVLPARNKKQ